VYDAPRIGAVLPAFLEFIRGSVLVAHNAGFDVGFLRAACSRLNLPWPGPAVAAAPAWTAWTARAWRARSPIWTWWTSPTSKPAAPRRASATAQARSASPGSAGVSARAASTTRHDQAL